jgi:hypothetical protein
MMDEEMEKVEVPSFKTDMSRTGTNHGSGRF